MPTQVGFRFKSARFLRDLRARKAAILRPDKTLRIIGQYVTEVAKQAFDKEQDPETGRAWEPLSPAYLAYKRKKGRSLSALVWSGKLKRSLGYSLMLNYRPGISKVLIGSADQKGPWHQFGTSSGGSARSMGSRVQVPARPFLGIGLKHEREIKRLMSKHLKRAK